MNEDIQIQLITDEKSIRAYLPNNVIPAITSDIIFDGVIYTVTQLMYYYCKSDRRSGGVLLDKVEVWAHKKQQQNPYALQRAKK